MNGRPLLITFILFLLLAPAIAQMAQPYEINPGKWVFYLREEYELKPIYFNFQIKNTENGTIKVSLKTIPPEYLYIDQYPDIAGFPDYSWITISETNITIPGGQTVEVPVHVVIPEQYFPNGTSSAAISNYNKSYEAWFLADQTAGPGNIQVDYRCRWVFLTPPRYVPPWERPGALFPFPDYVLYAIILIVIVLIVAVVIVLRRRKRPHQKKTKHDDADEDEFWKP
jgi:hypothetical protein